MDPSVLSPEEEWHGRNLPVKVTADTMILVNQIRVSGVLLVAPNSSLLEKRTKDFSRAMKDVSTHCLSQADFIIDNCAVSQSSEGAPGYQP